LPSDPYDVISCPTLASDNFVCPLDASDDQQVRLSKDMLSILLPICEYPGKNDWAWHSIKLNIPDYAAKRYANGEICRPSIRVDGDDIYLLVPLDVPTPEKRITGRTLSCDWGVRKLATCSVIYIRDGEAITTGRPFHFIGSGFQDKQHDRKDQAQIIDKKAWAIERLLSSKPDPDSDLSSKLDFYKRERASVWEHSIEPMINMPERALYGVSRPLSPRIVTLSLLRILPLCRRTTMVASRAAVTTCRYEGC